MKRSLFMLLALTLPALAQAADSVPSIGGTASPKVRITEFGDYQCPFCRRAHDDVIPKILAEYGDKVQIVFRNFPLEFHPQAHNAALAGICADQQGKLKEMHDFLYQNQTNLGDKLYSDGARQLGLNETAFAACLTSDLAVAKLNQDLSEAQDMMVQSTPNFILATPQGVERLNGAYPYAEFKAAIDRLLK